ncbi:MAG: hypothetical protein JNK20_01075 [Flavipsychrobacter sp.]|nr:hypothetical protein [Flavipsychrobacter sp.]
MAIAQVVILGHSSVSHHHDLLFADLHHCDSVDDVNDQHPSDGPFGIDFSGFIHTGDQATFTSADRVDYAIAKNNWQPIVTVVPDYSFNHDYVVDFQQHTFPPEGFNTYRSFFLNSFSLRGPPFIIVASLSC